MSENEVLPLERAALVVFALSFIFIFRTFILLEELPHVGMQVVGIWGEHCRFGWPLASIGPACFVCS